MSTYRAMAGVKRKQIEQNEQNKQIEEKNNEDPR
jgi:hypothetical protein